MATVALSGIITPTNVVTATSTTTLTNKTLTGAVMNGTLGATTPSTVVATTVKASTTMGVGGATPSASGSGVSFPATQSASSDANTLDDYEEGTWSPTIEGSATAGTASYSPQNGRYTKVGNIVTVSAYVEWSGQSGSGNMRLANFPFVFQGSGAYYGAVTFGYVSNIALSANNILTAYTVAGNTFCDCYQYAPGGGSTSALALDTAGGLIFSVTYTTST